MFEGLVGEPFGSGDLLVLRMVVGESVGWQLLSGQLVLMLVL